MYKKIFILVSLFLLLMSCNPKQELESIYIAPHCLASQSQCMVTNDIGQFNVLFNVDKVHGDMPFELTLTYPSVNENIKFSAYLEGKEMFMGKIPVFFTQVQNEQKQRSEVLLANCSEDQMVWRLWITAEVTDNIVTNELDDNNQSRTKRTFFIDFLSTRL